jgi:hypothetical protein
MKRVTAKVELRGMSSNGDGQTALEFGPDYHDDRNKEWAKYTPALSLSMIVLDSVAEHFAQGGKYTLTFEKSEETGE